MNEIPFVNALGDALESAITTPTPARTRARPGIRRLRGRTRLIIAIALMALGGAAYAATQQDSTTLATSGLACYESTGFGGDAYYDVETDGLSPQEACKRAFRDGGPRALAAPAAKLVACANPHGYVAVFQASGSSRQCAQLGLSTLQIGPYAAAQARAQRLIRALAKLQVVHACVAAETLEREVQGALRRLGWTGWRTAVRQQFGGGRCARFEATGGSISDPAASLDSARKTVWIVTGS
jgi:hypothetical protein